MTDFDELLDLERSGWIALCEGAGADFYGSTMTEKGRMVLAHGLALDRKATIDSLVDAPPWAGFEIADADFIPIGEDAAAIVYTAKAWRDDPDRPFRALMSSTYLRTDEGWRLALYQQTPIPDEG
ncbi:nuclear transport factor 2 family protein [Glycomyces sp. TRM65418]|uniref:nuclear transport factor 2 family protein n=1 Tax=Glycomyces sp. TRM65418 TaxID=2867006 RepID=UPI001CE6852F|nr:nuclear transport factor 2 family protein [Glycomyces sp. TRM65418]MCC3763485.1 nuclear transport factor 2 family protein [Glycomyces sp. TRM65418]QZD57471.1 nuclear transport factor 2 family protein [Glycomyces sp. TRM65418]